MIIDTTTLLAGTAIVGAVGLFLFHKPTRDLVTIWYNKLINGGTTPLEKQKKRYADLVALSKKQRDNVATSIAKSVVAKKTFDKLVGDAEKAKQAALDAVKMNMSEADQQSLAKDWKAAAKKAENYKATLAEFNASAEEARKSLAETARLLAEAAEHIETNEGKVELTKALKIENEVRDQLKEIQDGMGGFADADKAIDEELEKERAKRDMDKDGAKDRLEEERRKKEGQDALDELKKQNGGETK